MADILADPLFDQGKLTAQSPRLEFTPQARGAIGRFQEPLTFVPVVGQGRAGKSLLCSKVAKLVHPGCGRDFRVGSTTTPVTVGADYVAMPYNGGTMILVDVEGVNWETSAAEVQRAKMLVAFFAFSTPNLVVATSGGTNHKQYVDALIREISAFTGNTLTQKLCIVHNKWDLDHPAQYSIPDMSTEVVLIEHAGSPRKPGFEEARDQMMETGARDLFSKISASFLPCSKSTSDLLADMEALMNAMSRDVVGMDAVAIAAAADLVLKGHMNCALAAYKHAMEGLRGDTTALSPERRQQFHDHNLLAALEEFDALAAASRRAPDFINTIRDQLKTKIGDHFASLSQNIIDHELKPPSSCRQEAFTTLPRSSSVHRICGDGRNDVLGAVRGLTSGRFEGEVFGIVNAPSHVQVDNSGIINYFNDAMERKLFTEIRSPKLDYTAPAYTFEVEWSPLSGDTVGKGRTATWVDSQDIDQRQWDPNFSYADGSLRPLTVRMRVAAEFGRSVSDERAVAGETTALFMNAPVQTIGTAIFQYEATLKLKNSVSFSAGMWTKIMSAGINCLHSKKVDQERAVALSVHIKFPMSQCDVVRTR